MPGMTEVKPPDVRDRHGPAACRAGGAGRHAWPEAFEQLSQADRDGATVGGLRPRGTGAWPRSSPPTRTVELDAKERAFKAYEAEGNELRARLPRARRRPRVRLRGQVLDRLRLDPPCRAAHRRRGRDLRARLPRTDAERGRRPAMGDIDDGARARRAGGRDRHGRAADADLKAYALTNLGALKIASGATSDGLALMEEASIAAVNGELSPFTTGVTACRMIGACRDLTDYRRASEWIEATEQVLRAAVALGFPRRSAGSTAPRSRRSAGLGTGRSRSSSRPRPSSAHTTRRRPRRTGSTRSATSAGSGATSRAPRRRSARRTRRGRSPQPALALDPAGRGQGQGRGRGDQRGASPRRRGTAGREPGSCRPRSEIALAAGDIATGPDGGRRARRDRRGLSRRRRSRRAARWPLGRVLARRGRRRGGDARAARRRSRAGARSGSPYEVARAQGRAVARAPRARRRRGRRAGAAARRSTSSGGSAPASTSKPPSASSATPRTAGAAR